ncbi:hypothetical protein CVT24_004620 [Panaeolus cyanescens]|uniref:FAD-binding PCMH-type domain-containing protein n=1 Tax=Panaeolus cyanescens TaxID=181874 RepID=A0A409YSL2_9AGAR|nr:hypothetical protein CVT24_004620 [Panaeolus cyanescens]
MLLSFILRLLDLYVFSSPAGLQSSHTSIVRDPTCMRIQNEISSSSNVYYFGHPLYFKGISHWASSSSEISNCVVEPGTPQDVAIVLQIVGSTRTPFAVKGGGHTANAGFSSTTGVHISMYRFSEVEYDPERQTAKIGAGLLWDDVYAKLEPYNVNVVGGRVTGVGVAGFILGGGYSWKTNQYGLTIDTVVAFELVTPTGAIINVTHESEPELFFALKGSQNNFGIVTKFTLKTFPQTEVWGGILYYPALSLKAVGAATIEFHAKVKDPKASIIVTFGTLLKVPLAIAILFYDAPQPPPGIFDEFLRLQSFRKDVKTRTFSSLVKASPSNTTSSQRGMLDTVPMLDITPSIMNAIVNEALTVGSTLTLTTDTFFSFSVEPFLPNLYNHSVLPSAFPWTRSQPYMPFNLYASWLLPTSDNIMRSAIQKSAKRIRRLAIKEGQDIRPDAPKYVNYAPKGTDIRMVFGPQENIERLSAVKRVFDPKDVMGLAGGFKIPV